MPGTSGSTTWSVATPMLPTLLNHVDMRFGEHVTVRLTIQSEKPLAAAAWSRIGYSASDVANLAKYIDDLIVPPPPDKDGE